MGGKGKTEDEALGKKERGEKTQKKSYMKGRRRGRGKNTNGNKERGRDKTKELKDKRRKTCKGGKRSCWGK